MSNPVVLTVPLAVQVLLEYLEMSSVNQHNPGQLIHQLLAVVVNLETPNIINETTLANTYSSRLPSYSL